MRRDGSEFPAELTITHIRLRQQSIFSAHLRDITREKWAEQELRRYADGLRTVSRRLVEAQVPFVAVRFTPGVGPDWDDHADLPGRMRQRAPISAIAAAPASR